MARPRKTAEQRAEQRTRLQDAARELYTEQGLEAVTVRAVADRAGQSTGTLYSYFDNLAGLLRSLWIEPVLQAGRELEGLIEETPDPVDQVRLLLHAYIAFAHSSDDVVRGALLFVRPPGQQRPEPLPLTDLPFHQLLVRAVKEGVASGAFHPGEPELVAQVLWAGVHGAVALPVNADAYDLDESEAPAMLMIEMLMRSIVADRPGLSN